jgi:hypothetical protein
MCCLCRQYQQQQQRQPGNLQPLLQFLKRLGLPILVRLICQIPRSLRLRLFLLCRSSKQLSKQHQTACWSQTPVLLATCPCLQLPCLRCQTTAQGLQQQPPQAAVSNSNGSLTNCDSNSS